MASAVLQPSVDAIVRAIRDDNLYLDIEPTALADGQWQLWLDDKRGNGVQALVFPSREAATAFEAEVAEKTAAVREMEQRIEELRSLGEPEATDAGDQFRQLLSRLDAAQSLAASNWGPITLVAPISGMVSAVQRQQGEYILDGEPLVVVHSLWSDRVIGYLRQPYPIDPEIGLPVKVTTRTHAREQFWTSISQVGAQVDIITNALAYVRQGALVDVGLPIVIDLPSQSRIRPGEIVDLWIKPADARPQDRGGP